MVRPGPEGEFNKGSWGKEGGSRCTFLVVPYLRSAVELDWDYWFKCSLVKNINA